MTDATPEWEPTRIAAAIDSVRREQARLRAEATAFAAFAGRVVAFVPDLPEPAERTAPPTVHATGVGARAGTRPTPGTDRLRRAYRDTVMAVDHFEDDYDEPLAEHLAAELGSDIATPLLDVRDLTVPICTAVASAAMRARERRCALHDGVGDELDRLTAARTALERVAGRLRRRRPTDARRGPDALFEAHDAIEDLEAACGRVLGRRLAALRDGARRFRTDLDGHDRCVYLYGRHGWTYPVLADLADLLDRLRTERSRIAWRVARAADGYERISWRDDPLWRAWGWPPPTAGAAAGNGPATDV